MLTTKEEALRELKELKEKVKEWKGEYERELQGKDEQIVSLRGELKVKEEGLQRVEILAKHYEGLENSLAGIVENIVDKKYGSKPSSGVGGAMKIEAQETTVKISHTEKPMLFSTENQRGQIMYVLVNDLKGGPASAPEIYSGMTEHGWVMSNPKVLHARLSDMEKDGAIISEGTTKATKYRVPGKIKVEHEGRE